MVVCRSAENNGSSGGNGDEDGNNAKYQNDGKKFGDRKESTGVKVLRMYVKLICRIVNIFMVGSVYVNRTKVYACVCVFVCYRIKRRSKTLAQPNYLKVTLGTDSN